MIENLPKSGSITCPNCDGDGFVGHKKFDCQWCHKQGVIQVENWIDYQPHFQRPKEFLDILLRDGTIVECCWPNGGHFTAMIEQKPEVKVRRPVADYRVVKVRISQAEPW